jgi:hypothetical protein
MKLKWMDGMKKNSTLTRREMSDSGQALALVCLIVGLLSASRPWLWATLAVLVLNMACPPFFRWFAFLWLNFSRLTGGVVSRVIMTLEFFLLVLPVGLIRKAMGKDALALRKWRQGDESVFVVRNHLYRPEDLRNPY